MDILFHNFAEESDEEQSAHGGKALNLSVLWVLSAAGGLYIEHFQSLFC